MDTTQVCKAKSKQSGKPCRNYAVNGKRVCRIHGGKSTGAKTPEGKLRQKMASWKHGRRAKEAIEETRQLRALLNDAISVLSSSGIRRSFSGVNNDTR